MRLRSTEHQTHRVSLPRENTHVVGNQEARQVEGTLPIKRVPAANSVDSEITVGARGGTGLVQIRT
eukprot:3736049-Rhodomonas_salina.2